MGKVAVGDILRVENGESFPADLIVLSSSEPDGLCYIETANLDGETNLKIRQALQETSSICTPQAASECQGPAFLTVASIKTEMPNNSLYTFEGTLRLDSKELPLSPEQVLLRGAVLRNTNWVYGAVVFTGHETKLLKNSRAMPVKRSNIEKMTNTQILFLGGILVFLAVFSAVANAILTSDIRESHYYLRLENLNPWTEALKKILTFMILYNNLIPIRQASRLMAA
jgi:phospholipid-transporting ATPase